MILCNLISRNYYVIKFRCIFTFTCQISNKIKSYTADNVKERRFESYRDDYWEFVEEENDVKIKSIKPGEYRQEKSLGQKRTMIEISGRCITDLVDF